MMWEMYVYTKEKIDINSLYRKTLPPSLQVAGTFRRRSVFLGLARNNFRDNPIPTFVPPASPPTPYLGFFLAVPL